jgi:hypothetical protein
VVTSSRVYLVAVQGKPLSWTRLLPEGTLDIRIGMVLKKLHTNILSTATTVGITENACIQKMFPGEKGVP